MPSDRTARGLPHGDVCERRDVVACAQRSVQLQSSRLERAGKQFHDLNASKVRATAGTGVEPAAATHEALRRGGLHVMRHAHPACVPSNAAMHQVLQRSAIFCRTHAQCVK